MRFTKMHGLGNDYVFLDALRAPALATRPDLPDITRRISDRRRGVGSDGLIVVQQPTDAGARAGACARMRIFNADGSDGGRCGNGLRCVVKLVVERADASDPNDVRVEVAPGEVLRATAHTDDAGRVGAVTVDMGAPSFALADAPCDGSRLQPSSRGEPFVRAGELDGVVVSVGNPHFVVFFDGPIDGVDLRTLGPRTEHHPAFPERVNLQLVQVLAPNHARVRTWERGAGATEACGTGACAALAAGVRAGLLAPDAIITLPGGDLRISQDARTNRITQTGPATHVFDGEWGE